jgi:hypothetical protein
MFVTNYFQQEEKEKQKNASRRFVRYKFVVAKLFTLSAVGSFFAL